MRLSFLLLALVAAATAVPFLQTKAGNVDALKMQRDVLLLLQQMFQDIPNMELRKMGKEYEIEKNLHEYRDQGVVKYLIRAVKLGYIQRKGYPFSISVTKLRKDVAVLTRTFLCAKDYVTFLKTAAWARYYLNEEQFVKAFVAAILQRHDTRDMVVLPAPYEVFPYYYFDARVIRKAQDIRATLVDKTVTKKVIEIPVEYNTAWLPKGEHKLSYFTHDIGLSAYYAYFALAGWMMPTFTQKTEDIGMNKYECDRCEIGRGAQFYYVHQQLLARYEMERLSNNLMPMKDLDWELLRTPFKSHLSYPNGLEFPGRLDKVDLITEKKDLLRTVWLIERRLKDAIDSGFTISTQGSILALYDRKGLDVLGNMIESTGRSINPRYYGCLQGVARELLGGAPLTRYFFEPTPSVLEVSHTATRDPIFYMLFKRFIGLFKRYQDSLPIWKEDDLMVPGVVIEDVKFDKLVTYCDKFKADIDAATIMSVDKEKDPIQIKAVVDRLNHKPFNFEIIVRSEKFIKGAVVRVYIGPKYNVDGRYVNIKEHRLSFVELDQFLYDIKEGKNVILRKSIDAPMRSIDAFTKKDLLHKVEDALNSHLPFYPTKIAQMFGFPERLALPKGRRDGLPLQVVVIVSSPKVKTVTYGPVLSPRFQTYNNVDFEDYVGDFSTDMVGDYTKDIVGGDTKKIMGGRWMDYDVNRRNIHTMDSRERLDIDDIRDRQFRRYERSIDDTDTRFDMKRDYDTDTTRLDTLDTDTRNVHIGDKFEGNVNYMTDYYKDKHTFEMIGGAISLDGRPLGYPLDRPMTTGCLWIPNLKIVDVKVFYEGEHCRF